MRWLFGLAGYKKFKTAAWQTTSRSKEIMTSVPTVAWWSEPIGLVFELGNGEGFRKSKGHRRHSISESLTAGMHCVRYFKNWLSSRNIILVSKQK